MKKFNFRKILSLALAAFVAFGMLAVGTVGVNAEAEDWRIETSYDTDYVWAGDSSWFDVYDWGNQENGKITSATSSNNSVFSVDTYEDYGFINGLAVGTATLNVNFTTPAGETKSLSKNIVVKKYPKEIKSLKVNGKKVNTSKYKFFYDKKMSKSKTKATIKMALKKGWKITDIYADRSKNGDKWTQFKVSKSTLLKGKAIKFSKKYKYMSIRVTLKKGNDIIWYSFNFYRK